MIAVDTNVLARIYVNPVNSGESDTQRKKALNLLSSTESIYVPVTVILEFAWLLQSFYEFSAESLRDVLVHLTGLPNVEVERWTEVNTAAALACQGLDFADSLHASVCAHADQFVTFDDKKFARRAKSLGVFSNVRLL
jgi:predicted nucleic-acid-binding protein